MGAAMVFRWATTRMLQIVRLRAKALSITGLARELVLCV